MYRCENCGFQFEQQQKFSDNPLKICPECEQEALRKIYFPIGIVFKGSGFYSTDNRSTKGLGLSKSKEETNGKNSEEKASEGKASSEEKVSHETPSVSKDTKSKNETQTK
jgi:putative FmdB family regulatory protein